ncbi:hypothetical protein MBLNU230_g0772t1 [Neophaeotheca triangularis]
MRRAASRQDYTQKGMGQHSQIGRMRSSSSTTSTGTPLPKGSSIYSLPSLPESEPSARRISLTSSILNLYSKRTAKSQFCTHAKTRAIITSKYLALLQHFHTLHDLHIRTPTGNPGWAGLTPLETHLTALRTALETCPNPFPNLNKLTLSPTHAMGILHLRWNGFSAFGSATSQAPQFWRHITTLDLHLRNPYTAAKPPLSEQQGALFAKALRDYLASLAPTLQNLRFFWLEGEGPCPFGLAHTDTSTNTAPTTSSHASLATTSTAQQPSRFPHLQTISLASLRHPYATLRALHPSQTPSLLSAKILRSTHRGSLALTELERAGAWLEVPLEELRKSGMDGGEGQGVYHGGYGDRGESSVYSFYEFGGVGSEFEGF